MPAKDAKVRKATGDRWKKNRYTDAYMKWLYQRRKLSARIEEMYEDALVRLSQQGSQVAENALLKADALREETGNRFDHDRQKPYWKEL